MPCGIYERPTPEARFWANVEKGDDCWTWLGRRGGGNARYGVLGVNYRRVYAHRFSYELLVGPIPDGLTIDHLCRNTLCVNPDHLEPVTLQENIRRANILHPCSVCGREFYPRILALHFPACSGEVNACTKGHEFTEENTYIWRTHRSCRKCHADYERARRARIKAEREAAA